MAKTWRLVSPASSANLGPGFDCLGLALSPYLTCEFTEAPHLFIEVSGVDAQEISTGPDNFIWQTAVSVAESQGKVLPPLRLKTHNEIPLGKGLGSSAAALVAGVVIANEVLGLGWSKREVLSEAARREGHPDNVAACVYGSIVAAALEDEVATAVRLEVPAGLAASVVSPDFPLPTKQARKALPADYPRADLVFNLQRATLLIAALATGDLAALPQALGDRVHQPYRESLVPGLSEILKLKVPGLYGCALSGAGPSVLVFHEANSAEAVQHVQRIFAQHGRHSDVLATSIDRNGYTLDVVSA